MLTAIERTVEYRFNILKLRTTAYPIFDFAVSNALSFAANCRNPGIPRNGARKGDNFEHGQTVSFTCNNGYTLIGNNSMQCQEGVWSSSLPQCKSKFIFNYVT